MCLKKNPAKYLSVMLHEGTHNLIEIQLQLFPLSFGFHRCIAVNGPHLTCGFPLCREAAKRFRQKHKSFQKLGDYFAEKFQLEIFVETYTIQRIKSFSGNRSSAVFSWSTRTQPCTPVHGQTLPHSHAVQSLCLWFCEHSFTAAPETVKHTLVQLHQCKLLLTTAIQMNVPKLHKCFIDINVNKSYLLNSLFICENILKASNSQQQYQ